jgi:hypothetical protein
MAEGKVLFPVLISLSRSGRLYRSDHISRSLPIYYIFYLGLAISKGMAYSGMA